MSILDVKTLQSPTNFDLTLDAQGSGKDIIFKSDGTQVASISDAGLLTATTFAGSAASLTSIPAANITGTLPAISGANLTGVGSMVKLTSGSISTATTNIDIDLSSYTSTYGLFKIIVRNWYAASGRMEVSKLTSSGTAATQNWYGGYIRSGEGDSTDMEGYSTASAMRLASAATFNHENYTYYGEINIYPGAEISDQNNTHIDARGVGRISDGNSQLIVSGALTNNHTALWGIRLAASTDTTTMDYTVYGVVK